MTRRLVPFAHAGPTDFCKRRGSSGGAAIGPECVKTLRGLTFRFFTCRKSISLVSPHSYRLDVNSCADSASGNRYDVVGRSLAKGGVR